MRTTRSDIDIFADKLRKCYQYERNQLARNFSRPDKYRVPKCWQAGGREKKGKSVFHKLTIFCQQQEIDPINYIQWCLDPAQVLLGHPPEPNQLLNLQKMDAYRDSQPKLRQYRLGRFKRETDTASCEWAFQKISSSSEHAWAIVLLNEHLEVSPLLRYVYALGLALGPSEEWFLKIARRCEAGAMLQYQRSPGVYDRSWINKVLPPDFAEQATRFYDRLLEEEP